MANLVAFAFVRSLAEDEVGNSDLAHLIQNVLEVLATKNYPNCSTKDKQSYIIPETVLLGVMEDLPMKPSSGGSSSDTPVEVLRSTFEHFLVDSIL